MRIKAIVMGLPAGQPFFDRFIVNWAFDSGLSVDVDVRDVDIFGNLLYDESGTETVRQLSGVALRKGMGKRKGNVE